MKSIKRSYPLKLPQERDLFDKLANFKELVDKSSQELLTQLWSEKWLEEFDNTTLKAYKVIGENTIALENSGVDIYLPSRIKRCIAERVGRILRSQVTKRNCYIDLVDVIQVTGVTGNLDTLVKQVANTTITFKGNYYKHAIIRQLLRTLRRYYYRLGLDLSYFLKLPYTHLVIPSIHSSIFPYAADDGLNGQAIKLTVENQQLTIQLKLPMTKQPINRNDWLWKGFQITIPSKIYQQVNNSCCTSKLHLPTLRYLTLKNRLTLPFLELVWSSQLFVSFKSCKSFLRLPLRPDPISVISRLIIIPCFAAQSRNRCICRFKSSF